MAISRERRRTEYYLPQELWMEILSRLPVKTLLKLRCVCKTWCSLIQTPDFISKNIISYNRSHKTSPLLTLDTPDDYCEIKCEIRRGTDFGKIAEVGLGLWSDINEEFDVVGYVNGVVCLKFHRGHEIREIKLFNPSIRKTLNIPLPEMSKFQIPYFTKDDDHINMCGPSYGDDRVYIDIAFGFDDLRTECKVLAMGFHYKTIHPGFYEYAKYPHVFEIYAPSSGSWRTITGPQDSTTTIPSCFWCPKKVYVNGVVHWLGDDGCTGTIYAHVVAFNMNTEVFTRMGLPECQDKGWSQYRRLLVYGESSLGLLESFEFYSCLWVMKEHGVKESWMMLCKLDLSLRYGYRYLKKDDELLIMGELLMACNIKNREIRCVTDKNPGDPCLVDTYVESLLLLK